MRLEGCVAVVTGGARGLGKVFSSRLYEEGAKIVIADVLEPKEAALSIDRRGREVLAVCTDVSQEESADEMARRAVEEFGRIDILVNNAAISATLTKKPFYEISAREWDKVMEVNLKGVFLCCKAVYPYMKRQGKGKIINISSGVFFKGLPNFLHYVASKGGVIGITRALARETGNDGICVNAISPGYTLTDFIRENPHDPVEFARSIVLSRCFKREALPDDLTGTLVFLASSESDFITGQTIVVDGGSFMH